MSLPKNELNNDSQLFLLAYESYEDENRKTPVRTQVFSKGADIGRDYHCEVYLHSNTVSAIHAKIEFESETGKWFVSDQQSKNGVVHNGVRVSRQELKNGDRIQLGASLLIVQIRSGALEKTQSFAMALEPKARPSTQAVLKLLGVALVFFFIHFQMDFHQTAKSIQEELWMFFMIWFSMWLSSMAWSFQMCKKPHPLFYAFFQFKAFIYFGILSALYPVFAMSFLPASWDGVVSTLVLGGAAITYLNSIIVTFQRRVSRRNALALAVTLVVGFVGLKKVGDHFTGETLLKPRFAYSFFLPSSKHETGELITALDKAFDKVKETNLDQ